MTPTRATAMALLLVATGLAGCVGDDGVEGPTTNDIDTASEGGGTGGSAVGPPPAGAEVNNATAAEGFTTQDCEQQLAFVPFPAMVLEMFVPPGFEPVPFEGTPGTVTVFAFAFNCLSTPLDGNETGETRLMSGGLLVDPPDEYEGAFDAYAVVIEGYTENAAIAHMFQGWNVNIGEGGVVFDIIDGAAAYAGMAWAGTMRLETATGAPGGIGEFDVRMFGVVDGNVTGFVDVEAEGTEAVVSGTGQFHVEEVPPIPMPPGAAFLAWGAEHALTFTHTPLGNVTHEGGEVR